MAALKDVCRHVRSKNAGPFWVTIDVFFNSDDSFTKYVDHAGLGADAIGALYGVEASLVKRFPAPRLRMVKISYPRASAQGGEVERDMHCGQQFVRLLNIELD